MLVINGLLKMIWYLQWLFVITIVATSIIILVQPKWIDSEKLSGFQIQFSKVNIGDIKLNDGLSHDAYLSSGTARLHISDFKQPYIFLRLLLVLLDALIYIYIIYQLQQIFKNLKTENFFNATNGLYTKKIAYAVITQAVFFPITGYFVNRYIFSSINLSQIEFYSVPSFDFNAVFLGLLIFAIAKAFIKGAELKAEQELTI